MKRVTITIETTNAAFDHLHPDTGEVIGPDYCSETLHQLIRLAEKYCSVWPENETLTDLFGNRVGQVVVE